MNKQATGNQDLYFFLFFFQYGPRGWVVRTVDEYNKVKSLE